jgi:hypothetical protein
MKEGFGNGASLFLWEFCEETWKEGSLNGSPKRYIKESSGEGNLPP